MTDYLYDPASGARQTSLPAPDAGSGRKWGGPDRHTTWPADLQSADPADHPYESGVDNPSVGPVPVNIVGDERSLRAADEPDCDDDPRDPECEGSVGEQFMCNPEDDCLDGIDHGPVAGNIRSKQPRVVIHTVADLGRRW